MLGELPGGWENIGFSNQDVRNILRDIRHYVFDSSDALEGLVLNAFVPFTGVNHHYQSILFRFALIRDETEESYLWVFKSWLEAMGNVAPQTIITDQDIAIGNAIAKVLPNTIHLYCRWNIRTKFGEILSHLYANQDHFKEDFNSCIYKSLTGAQFEDSTGFKEFMENSRKTLEKQHLREREADYEKKNKERSKITSSSLENHAASTYMKEMLRRFQHELKESGAYVVIEKKSNAIYQHYEAYKTTVQEEYRKYYVLIVTENGTITCVCRKFESLGILCRHIVRYLYKMQRSEIPKQYITLRWMVGGNERVGALQHKRPKIGNFLLKGIC
ncbi:protein FAR1-RELATED SEQUENCE 5-like [Daucus carota subsp. sativus]|uniref:protein FAR1-RELATED SEQUENCE 5-like n=1 Tax=Daucus carota subsp. sativus TaxID=79200 RepID=UPI003083DB96